MIAANKQPAKLSVSNRPPLLLFSDSQTPLKGAEGNCPRILIVEF